MKNSPVSRRQFLTGATAALAAAATPALLAHPAIPEIAAAARPRRRVLRIAHLTDTHVMPPSEGFQDSAAGLARAIRHAQGQADKPDVIFFGGDLVMDALKRDKANVVAQWDVWKRAVADEVKIPYRICLGNHDVWGWASRQFTWENDPQYGKRLALDTLGLEDRYYAFDQAGWHFVVLDSTQIDYDSHHGYTARFDDAQFAWLAADLAATPPETPILILSHIPILASCVFFDDDLEKTGTWVIPGAWMHIDARRCKDLFRRHPNVKVCLSGHVHLVDDVNYLGVRYLCNGAVCGGWWKGSYQEFGPAYALVDLYDDGTVDNRVVAYS
jgi:3',5'-cyclic AMP phosphodiesterase CpdA